MTETAQPKWTWEQHNRGAGGMGGVEGGIRELRCGTRHVLQRGSPLVPEDDGFVYDLIPQMCSDLNAAEEQRHATEPKHPANCGGQYNGLGFVDPEQRVWRARCVNHGLRLVEGPRGGPFVYVAEPDATESGSAPEPRPFTGSVPDIDLTEPVPGLENVPVSEPQMCPTCHGEDGNRWLVPDDGPGDSTTLCSDMFHISTAPSTPSRKEPSR